MSKKIKCIAALLAFSASGAMASIVLDFNDAASERSYSAVGDRITFDFTIDDLGVVSLVSTPVGSATDAEYLAAVNSWTSSNVGAVYDPRVFGQSFQLTLYIVRMDRKTGFPVGTERLSTDGRYASGGQIGSGGGNGSRIDWTSGPQEQLHIEQTGGTVQINLVNISYDGGNNDSNIWDMQLIAGGIDHQWDNMVSPKGTIDVSLLGYVIGRGENDLIMQQQLLHLDGSTSGKGVGLAGMTLDVVFPEPSTPEPGTPEPEKLEPVSVG